MVKKTLLLCVFLLCILALPVQGQTPAPPSGYTTDLTNLADCGLPEFAAQLTSSASIKTFNLTEDCVYGSWSAAAGNALMYITSGEFTINGNGHTITGPNHTYLIYATGANTVLNLNDVIIEEAGQSTGNGARSTIEIISNATLNSRNLILRNNRPRAVITARFSAQLTFRNLQLLNNVQTGSGLFAAMRIYGSTTATITNGIFRGNQNAGTSEAVISSSAVGTTVTLNGCMTFENNVQADGTTAALDAKAYGGATLTDNRTGPCPAIATGFSYWLSVTPQKKPKKTATPWPSATARPLGTTCIDLNQATGIVVHATYGLASGVQCQRLGGGGIGVQAIVDGGFIDAVDIWGYVEQGVEVCFPQAGNLLFLDARMMPRAIAPLASQIVNGMTCGAIETPGSIVLMPPS